MRSLLMILMLALCAQADAGPLRERLAERRAAAAGIEVRRDIAYGSSKEQVFDVHAPRAAAGAPVIFMVHGGGWRRGDKAAGAVVENKVSWFTARGYAVVSANYRMLPEADPLTQARDVAAALAAVRQMAPQLGLDGRKIILMGHSAGAHLVSLLAASSELRGQVPVLGVVALDSAAMDVEYLMQHEPLRLHKEAFGSDPAYWRAVSPSAQLSGAHAPMLAVCSTRREQACDQARRHADRARQLGTRIDVMEVDMSHRDINVEVGEPGAYTDALTRFIGALTSR